MSKTSVIDHILSVLGSSDSKKQKLSMDALRQHIIGSDTVIDTPFGQRIITYADYTASGRSLEFIENYMKDIQCLYANTHTEDDTTGRTTSALFHQAENIIKQSVGATDDDCIITCGDGATAAIYRLQQILGVAVPPATYNRLKKQMVNAVSKEGYEAITFRCDMHSP